jgi:hypothetical protein
MSRGWSSGGSRPFILLCSCRLLDALGKGFADYVRDRVVDVPVELLEGEGSSRTRNGDVAGNGVNGHANGANL